MYCLVDCIYPGYLSYRSLSVRHCRGTPCHEDQLILSASLPSQAGFPVATHIWPEVADLQDRTSHAYTPTTQSYETPFAVTQISAFSLMPPSKSSNSSASSYLPCSHRHQPSSTRTAKRRFLISDTINGDDKADV